MPVLNLIQDDAGRWRVRSPYWDIPVTGQDQGDRVIRALYAMYNIGRAETQHAAREALGIPHPDDGHAWI